MKNITIQSFTTARIPAVVELQAAYTAVYPEAPVIPGEVYLSPAYESGRNIFCAVDESGRLSGYAPVYPALVRDGSDLPHTVWTEIKTDPACEAPVEIKDLLLGCVRRRALEAANEFPGHAVHLTFQYFPSESASIEYVLSRGCQQTESVFTMRRDLSKEISTPSPVAGITLRPWRMESEAEQRLYVQARNECFPEAPIGLEEWQYFMQSPHWAVGTTFAAFDRDQLVGNISVFWDEAENERTGCKIGFTEYIFVRSAWRGQNIARSLINHGLKYLKEHGLDEAHLEARARNEGALSLYHELGYEVIRESRFYVLAL